MADKKEKSGKKEETSEIYYADAGNGVFYLHCQQCIKELPVGMSPKDFAQYEVVLINRRHLGIGCKRHKKPIGVFDIGEQIMSESEDEELVCEHCQEKHKEVGH